MPKYFYIVPVLIGLGFAIGVQVLLASSDIPTDEQNTYHFLGLGASIFFASLSMAVLQSLYERSKRKNDESQ